MNFGEFKTYVVASLWREFDSELETHFATLLAQANDELDQRTADWQARNKVVTVLPTSGDYLVTADVADFKNAKAIINNSEYGKSAQMSATTLENVYVQRAIATMANYKSMYCMDTDGDDRYIRFVNSFSPTEVGNLTLIYKAVIPAYTVDADTSWLLDRYLNVYTYTIMKHAAIFLREDDRVSLYAGMQDEALKSAELNDKHDEAFGIASQPKAPVHHVP